MGKERWREKRGTDGDQKKVCESDFQDVFEEWCLVDESEGVGDSCGDTCGAPVCVPEVSSCVLVVIDVLVSPSSMGVLW